MRRRSMLRFRYFNFFSPSSVSRQAAYSSPPVPATGRNKRNRDKYLNRLISIYRLH